MTNYTEDAAAGLQLAIVTRAKARLGIYELEADQLSSGRWAVRPKGQLGTCGYYPYAWTVAYVKAFTAEGAIKRAIREGLV